MKQMHGQTLVELMVCLLIGGIMLTLAIPPLNSSLKRNQQTLAVNQLLGAMHYARTTAVTGRKTIALCSGGNFCDAVKTWEGQVLVFDDLNLNGQFDSGEDLLQQFPLPEGSSWHWSNFRSRAYLQFEADGTTRALNGTFTLCHDSSPSRQIVINATGRAKTQIAAPNAPCG